MATLPDLSIRQLEYVVAIDRSPSWAAAAKAVGVTPSALSQGIAELERRVGVSLYRRDGRRRVLRAEAQPVLDHARHVVASTADLVAWAERTRRGELGRLRVGMIDVAAVHHYPDLLRSFRAERPEVDLRLTVEPSSRLLEELVDGTLDLVVCVETGEVPSGTIVEPLRREQLAIYRPDGRRAGPAAGWGPWVLFPEGSHTRRLVEVRLRELGAPIEVVAESHQPDVLREMVDLGLGWTVLPASQAEAGPRPLSRGRVLGERQLVLVVRESSARSPAVDTMMGLLRGHPQE